MKGKVEYINFNKICRYNISNNNNNKIKRRNFTFSILLIGMLLILSIISVISTLNSDNNDGYNNVKNEIINQAFADHPHTKDPSLWAINSGHPPSVDNFILPEGYKIEPILWNLTLPGSIAFDDKGNMYIAEVGYSYGQFFSNPKIIKLDKNNINIKSNSSGNNSNYSNNLSIVTDRFLFAPLTDIAFNSENGLLYAQHRAQIATVNVSNGLVNDLVVGLPTEEALTHPQGQLAFSHSDDRLYFTTGTFTNTGIVDKANYNIGWLKTDPSKHDIPAIDITLTGQNYKSPNWLNPPSYNGTVTTGAYVPFGTSTEKGQVIQGSDRCTGCLFSIRLDGSDFQTHAWGLRSPYGMVFDNHGRLFIANNGADDKGSRPVTGDIDTLLVYDTKNKNNTANTGNNSTSNLVWYGWPEFLNMGVTITDPRFAQSPSLNQSLDFLFEEKPQLTKPFASLGFAVGQTQAAYSNNSKFGMQDKILVAEFGTISPITHQIGFIGAESMVGQKILAVDAKTGNTTNFISIKNVDPTFRPVGLEFSPDGSELYITSYGKTEIRTTLPDGTQLPKGTLTPHVWPHLNGGVVWKVTKQDGSVGNSTGISQENNMQQSSSTLQQNSRDRIEEKVATTLLKSSSTIIPTATTTSTNLKSHQEQEYQQSLSHPLIKLYYTFPSFSSNPSESKLSNTLSSSQLLNQSSQLSTIIFEIKPLTTTTETTSSSSTNAATATNITNVLISKGSDVFVNERFYVPTLANITSGSAVKWTNNDITPHTATSGIPKDEETHGKIFDSMLIKPNGVFEHTFDKTGEYPYFCMIHPWMIGAVTVSQ